MQFVTRCLVGLIFILFESFHLHASESENETSLIAEIFQNTPIVLNGSDLQLITLPPLTPIYNGKCDYSTCSDTTSTYSPLARDQLPCKCDQSCIEFRDCCADSKYYHREDQKKPSDYECHQIGDSGYFLKRTCASSWDDVEISDKCFASVTHVLDNIEEIELRSPVTSSVTNITYGNIYCAYCNYELDGIILWNMSVENCNTISIVQSNDTDSNTPNMTATMPDVPLYDNDINANKKPVESPNLTFDGKNWYYEDKTTRYSNCALVLQPPKMDVIELQHCSTSSVIRDCPTNWTDQSVADQCGSAHSRVYNWHGTAYRNKYCAYCNGLNDFDLTCDSFKIFATPLGITRKSFSLPKQQFTVLFDFKLKTDSKICNQTKKSYHNIQKKLCPHDTEFHRGKHSKHDSWYHSALSVYTLFAVLISLIFLLLHLTIFFFVQELQTIGGKNLASFCIALILGYASFLLGNFAQDDLCYVTAVVMYYSFLSAFFWMMIISYDMWHTFWNATKKFRSPKNVEKTFIIYSILVWTMPLALVGTTLYFDLVVSKSLLAPHFGYSGCWFDNGISLLVFFVAPVCVILIVNAVLFLHTSYMLHSNRCESVNQKSRVNFKLFTRIGLLTGFTWITGFVAGYTQILIIWFIFVVLNTAQGIFIFTAFSCKKRVIRSFLKRINKFEKWQRHLDESNVKSSCTTSTPLTDTVVVNS